VGIKRATKTANSNYSNNVIVIMPPPLIGGALSDDDVWRLTSVWYLSVWRLSVCLSRTSGPSREQRDIGRLKLAQR